MDFMETDCEDADSIQLAQYRVQIMNFRIPGKAMNFLTDWLSVS
jgi:hypothetical protein